MGRTNGRSNFRAVQREAAAKRAKEASLVPVKLAQPAPSPVGGRFPAIAAYFEKATFARTMCVVLLAAALICSGLYLFFQYGSQFVVDSVGFISPRLLEKLMPLR